jgi:hypothetical protein
MEKRYDNLSITNTIAFITMGLGDILEINLLFYIGASIAVIALIFNIIILTKAHKQEEFKKKSIRKSILEAIVSILILAISIANVTI